MDVTPRFYHVRALAEHLGRALAVYDLETSTFRGRPNFAITEVAVFMVLPGREHGIAFGHLINPERRIDAMASEITGITPAMVAGAQTWGVRYAALFQKLAREQVLCGFNNHTFDGPALQDMGARYGHPIESFAATLDVRMLHLQMTRAKSRAGKLEAVAASYGIRPRATLHRASADVLLTLETLDAMVQGYGVAAIAQAGGLAPGKPSSEAAGIDAYAQRVSVVRRDCESTAA